MQRKKLTDHARQAFDDKGKEMTENKLEHIKKQMEKLKSKLEEFAVKHRHEINKNTKFRAQFQTMCNKLGVDTLASNRGYIS